MAVAVLSPWPSTPAALTAARACLKASIAGGANLTEERTDALGGAGAAMVERFAPDAPQAIKNEATIRIAGWLHAREPKGVQSVALASGMRFDFRERFYAPSAMVNSGARPLLLPWRVRRALPAEDTS